MKEFRTSKGVMLRKLPRFQVQPFPWPFRGWSVKDGMGKALDQSQRPYGLISACNATNALPEQKFAKVPADCSDNFRLHTQV